MNYCELAVQLYYALVEIENYKNIVGSTEKLSESLIYNYLKENRNTTLKDLQGHSQVSYDTIYEIIQVLIVRQIVTYNGFLLLNGNSTISLTEHGLEELEITKEKTVEFLERQLKKLSPDDAAQFVTYALKIINTDSPKM